MRINKRFFYGKLSEGRGVQLLIVAGLIIVLFLIFWGLSALFWYDDFKWQDIIAHFLDPGVFAGPGDHDWFRLLITIVGVFFCAALLTTAVINIFENIGESYKKGEARYRMKGHVLILGANHMLIGMLNKLRDAKDEYQGKQIVIMTTQSVEQLRDRIEAYFGDDRFMKRISYYFDERDELNNLQEANADKAFAVFVIGEDGEDNHDAINLKCLQNLQLICREAINPIHCYVVMDSLTTMRIYDYTTESDNHNPKLLVDVIHADEYEAERVITSDQFPGLDRSFGVDGTPIPGIGPHSEQHAHLVVFGMGQMGQSFAMAAANLMHFPNFKDGKNRSIITFIGENIRNVVEEFQCRFTNLFELSHSQFISFDGEGKEHVVEKHPNTKDYDDFLDIEWCFIEASPFHPNVRNRLSSWAKDIKQSLSLAICYGSSTTNTDIALNLPQEVYRVGHIPIFVHIQDFDNAIEKAKLTKRFGELRQFGAASTAVLLDPLFQERTRRGMRVNLLWDQKFNKDEEGNPKHDNYADEKIWYGSDCREVDKQSSIYCGVSVNTKLRSFGLAPEGLKSLSLDIVESLCEVEHRRWVSSEFLMGYRAPAKGQEPNKKDFIHPDMIPFDKLPENEKGKDRVIIDNLSFIITGHKDNSDN